MIDFNEAEVQGAGGAGAIPEDSVVPFKMTIRQPKADKQGNTHALFCRSSKGNEYIDVEFEAMGNAGFAGRKIWQNFTLVGSDQGAKISMRTLRAIIESARGIAPSDASPAAAAGRQISDWADFNEMVFLAKVKTVVEQSQKDGNYYVNNEIKRVITPDDEEYSRGEWISDKPLPAVPEAGEQKTAASAGPAAGGDWGASPAPGATATTAPPAQKADPTPSWAKK